MGRIVMKPFSLKEYLKNPSRKVITRDGRNVKIHCTNCVGAHPVITEIEGEKYSYFYDKNGGYYFRPTTSDLFFAPEKKEGWINLFRDPTDNEIYCSRIYPTKEKAMDSIGAFYTTIKVEWEE